MALDVDSAPPGSPGELGVLPRSDWHTGLAVELLKFLENNGARGHIDAEGEGLGGEHRLDELLLEELFDHLLERWQHSGVMGGNPAL